MSEYLVNVTAPKCDRNGVRFSVVRDGHEQFVHISYEALGGMRSDRSTDEWHSHVAGMPEALQVLVDEGGKTGWTGAINWSI
jgi:hypothetical protein